LAGERISETKHEYLAGVVYAMAGASCAHDRISLNITGELRSRLRGKRCAHLVRTGAFASGGLAPPFTTYADAGVDCTGSKADEVDVPTVVFESAFARDGAD